MSAGAKCIKFLQTLKIPEGPRAGKPLRLAPFQKDFVRGAMAPGINVALLSIGRGNGKTALSAGLALAAMLGVYDSQPRREIVLAARTSEQARISWNYVVGFMQSLPEDVQAQITIRKSPRLEIEFNGDGGGHIIKAIPADGRSALGGSPVLVIADERSSWRQQNGDMLEAALLTGIGKRSGRMLMISTSADSDQHAFSIWLDSEQPGVYRQEHRAEPGLPADDRDSLLAANPGSMHGIGAGIDWLQAQGKRAIARGGSSLTSFRLYCRNERVSGEDRDVLLSVDEWLSCETTELPERAGGVVVGIDLGGSASMSAVCFYWPDAGRMETLATFPTFPSLADRGATDGVAGRYVEMFERGELSTLGDKTVPIQLWLKTVMKQVDGEHIQCIIADRYKQAELGEAIDRAGIKTPVIWRGTGWISAGEDIDRFRRAAFDGMIKSAPSLLMRAAFADAVVLKDPANNLKLSKGRSNGRIDSVQAAVIAVAEGVRRTSRPMVKKRAPAWV